MNLPAKYHLLFSNSTLQSRKPIGLWKSEQILFISLSAKKAPPPALVAEPSGIFILCNNADCFFAKISATDNGRRTYLWHEN